MGTIWGVVLLATLGGFDSDLDSERPVHDGTGAAVAEQVAGNTLVGLDTRLSTFRILYERNGTARLRQDNRTDSGKWWIDTQGRICDRWQRLWRGEPRCYRWEADDDRVIYYDGTGRVRAHAQLISGNPYGL
ncbi:MAG: hypothetical protein UMU75_02450 [Halomonas sp.]|nr:hypothetical protein [Halomonas sp.]